MTALLTLHQLHKDFDGLEVIRGVDLAIEEGERHAVIGPNGAGKTTLTNIITGKYRPSRGRLSFRGKDITGWKPHHLVRLGIGRSFQIINIFPEMSVFENIRNAVLSRHGIRLDMAHTVGGLRKVRKDSERIVEMVGLEDSQAQRAASLPYGAQRSLEIGLALACEPELIILDEPAAGMSAAETRDVTALIKRVTEGKTLILIEHDMDVVFSLADRISVLHYGQIMAQGSPAEIRQNPEVKEVYLGYRT